MKYQYVDYIHHMEQVKTELLSRIEPKLSETEKAVFNLGFSEATRSAAELIKLHGKVRFND